MDEREASQLTDVKIVEDSISKLKSILDELEIRKADIKNEMQTLRERADKAGTSATLQELLVLLESLKTLEQKEAAVHLHRNETLAKLQDEVRELDEIVSSGNGGNKFANYIDRSLDASGESLNAAKRELASKLREFVKLKRSLDDVPTQSELIQYELRFSELNFHIQGKLQQTRKLYATYNALLEIKELMLKETSLLNSISSQFQDAISSTAGRSALVSSMEGILKSTQQKLQSMQLTLQAEQKACEALKEKHTTANLEQRRCQSLLKSFQEECARNEKLRRVSSDVVE